jgi:hypothetical protein
VILPVWRAWPVIAAQHFIEVAVCPLHSDKTMTLPDLRKCLLAKGKGMNGLKLRKETAISPFGVQRGDTGLRFALRAHCARAAAAQL